jgi:hypothetical protein
MRSFLSTLFISGSLAVSAQPSAETIKRNYDSAFVALQQMLEGHGTSFKKAVFITENAYLSNQLNYSDFDKAISYLAARCRAIAEQSQLAYSERDKETVKKNAAVFRFMTDTVKFYKDSVNYKPSFPYTYDFDDFWGEQDWTKMFVLKLLKSNKGNCHSLPFLYKMLCEELGTKAYLTMAPNHTYIKQFAQQCGWYNTELTSGQFPIDAWIMASGYIHLTAIQNGVYMDTLSEKQSLAVCVTDLAKGYERKAPKDYEFILKCADLALKYYPIYPNALILKAETMKKQFEKMMTQANTIYPSQILNKPEAKKLFDEMEKLYFHIHQLGYRTMPKEMYVDWLVDLKKNKSKYQNKEISKFNSLDKK